MVIGIALLACFFFGSIPFGLIMGKLVRGIDIREYGSGNIGATNVMRTLGTGTGAIVMALDAAKGLGAVLLCQSLGLNDWLVVAGAMLSILGHTFSVFLRFRGGKGVATSLGVIFGLDWRIALIAFIGWLLIVAGTRYISLASIIAAVSVPLQMIFWKSMAVPLAYQVLAGVAATAIFLKHIPNIKRLLNGSEARVGQRVDVGEKDGEKAVET